MKLHSSKVACIVFQEDIQGLHEHIANRKIVLSYVYVNREREKILVVCLCSFDIM